MKILFLSLLSVATLSLGAGRAVAGDSCSISADWHVCGIDGEVFDEGCSVTCEGKQVATCQPATAFDIPGPYGMHGACQLVPSFCACN